QTTTTTSTSTTSVTFISMTSTTLTITRVTALSIQTALMSTSCTLQSSTDVHSSDIASIYSFSTDNAITTTKSGITSITHYNRRFFLSMSTAPFFIAPSCSNTTNIGLYCNISSSHCSMLDPCRNNATCNNLTNSDQGYVCSCPAGFNSTQCQLNYQSCKPTTCLNNGACNVISTTEFDCSCVYGWTDTRCQSKIDFCQTVTCLNNGVCFPHFLNYSCACLHGSSSGLHCEVVATRTIVSRIISKSIAYIAIIVMTVTATFFVIMDVLKYCFGIDPTAIEEDRRKGKRKKRKVMIQRFEYIDAPHAID
ncbi:unnamed protein product, partial [Adineta ricciae]